MEIIQGGHCNPDERARITQYGGWNTVCGATLQSDKVVGSPEGWYDFVRVGAMRTVPKLTITLLLFFAFSLAHPVAAAQGGASRIEEALARAQQLIQKGEISAAREELARTMKRSPDEPAVYNLLGVIEAQEGNARAAESHFRKAIELAPRYEGAYENLGRLIQERGKSDPKANDAAVEIYKRLLYISPGSLEAKYQLAALSSRKGDYRESLEYLKLLPQQQRERAPALSLMCADYAELGDGSKAAEAARQLIESPDLTDLAVLPILPLLMKQEAPDIAMRLLEGLDRRGLATSAALYELGVLYERQGRLLEARAVLLRTAELQPNSVPILVELARVAEKQKDHTSALSFLAHARDLEPRNASIHFFFGMVCVQMNLVEEAYRSLKQAVELDAKNPYHHYAMGVAAEQKSRYPEAVQHFQKYCELKPNDVRGRLALGIAYFYGYQNELARKEFDLCVQHPETAAAAHYFLGRLANQDGNLDQALQEIQESLKRVPDFAAAYAELGNLHMKRKEYDQAEEALKKALALEPEDYQANFYLAMLYARTRDPRADEQSRAFEELKKRRSEKMKEFYRLIEIRPLG